MIDFWDLLQVPIAALAVVVLAVISGRMLWELIPRGSTSFSPFRAITDRLAWFIPPWRTVARSRGFADVCHVLAEAADAGQPLDRALAEAAEACANRVLELRVRQWSQRVSAGVSMSDAARQAKMPTLLVGMLSTAQGPGGIQDVLRFLLRYYDSRYSTAMALLNGAAIPLMVVLLAFFVLTAALGLFMPLVELMNHVGGAKGVM
jgi:type II secretory pathway component PulF